MKKRSRKRIALIVSIFSLLGWMIFIFIDSKGFSDMDSLGWVIVLIGSIIFFFIPQLIWKIVYWVIDGFSKAEFEKKSCEKIRISQ